MNNIIKKGGVVLLNNVSFYKLLSTYLFKFYLIEKNKNCNEEILFTELPFKAYQINEQSNTIKHVLSHQHLYCKFYLLKLSNKPKNLNWIKIENIQKIAWPRVIDKYINTCLINKFN